MSGSARRRPLAISAIVVALGLTLTISAGNVRIVRRLSLASHVRMPLDVRWATAGDAVFVSVFRGGVIRIPLPPREPPRQFWQSGSFPAVRLATSERWMVVGSSVREMLVRDLTNGEVRRQSFGAIADVDLHKNRILVLGLEKNEKQWSPDEAIAWLGEMSGTGMKMTPVLRTAQGRVRDYMNCHLFDLGAARFLPDGRFVIAPGAEPGIYLFGKDGKQLRTWKTEDHFDACSITEEQANALLRQESRATWCNQRRILDEIVDLPGGFGAIVRFRERNVTHWELLYYAFGSDKVQRTAIPIESDRPYARLKADARGAMLVFLIADHGGGPGAPLIPERLVVAEYLP